MNTLLQYIRDFDLAVLRLLNPHKQTSWVSMFQALSNTTSVFAYGVPVLLFIIAVVTRKWQEVYKSLAVFIAVLVADYGALAIKVFINRQRPYDIYDTIIRYSDGGNASFPSGHTTQAMALAFSFALLYRNRRVAIPLGVWATLVGFGRVYLGVHFPSDVVGATLLAGIVAALARFAWRRVNAATRVEV